jgi:plastocyanin
LSRPRGPRESLVLPVLIPVGTLAIIGAVLFLFSRVLLRVTPTTATVIALITAVSVLGVASYVASRRQAGGVAMFSMVAGILGIAMLAGGVGLLVGEPTEEAQPTVLQLVAPPGADTEGFATTSLAAPAAQPFEIAFDNQESGVQHDVVIATADPLKDSSAQTLLDGQVITGPAQITYPVDPLDPGKYFFFCKIHPQTMQGALDVSAAPAPGGGGGLQVVAHDLAFDTSEFDLKSGAETPLTFSNEDPGVEHNIAIYPDSSGGTPLFQGERIFGPGSTTYTIPSLEPGQYYFQCDVHPTMNGTVVVSKPSGGGGGGQGGGGQGGGGQGGGGPPHPSASASASTSASASPSG